jgi:hypothetical protein
VNISNFITLFQVFRRHQIVALIALVFAAPLWAKNPKLKTGDILLQPLHCWVCNLIEGEENTPYSHVGVLSIENGIHFVYEAFSKVRKVTLTEYLKKTEKGKSVKVIRHSEFRDSYLLQKLFSDKYLGLNYDADFRLNNSDHLGEKLYCSELVYLLINPFVKSKFLLKEMHFNYRPELWDRYFRGNTPRGELGISPQDLLYNPAIEVLGEL